MDERFSVATSTRVALRTEAEVVEEIKVREEKEKKGGGRGAG